MSRIKTQGVESNGPDDHEDWKNHAKYTYTSNSLGKTTSFGCLLSVSHFFVSLLHQGPIRV